jgi:hypothetical protein
LSEAGEKFPGRKEDEKPEAPKPRAFGLLSPKKPAKPKKPKKPKVDKFLKAKEVAMINKQAKGLVWVSYKNFKKAHGLVTW